MRDRAPIEVSVIIPVFDDAHRIGTCLTALHAQVSPPRFEIVVVDNGSTDDIAGVVSKFPMARLVQELTPGSYMARNTGVAAAAAHLLAFTDADCRPHADWLLRGVEAATALGPEGVVAGDIELFVDGRPPGTGLPGVAAYELATAFRQRYYVETLRFGPTANLFVHRRTFEAVGGFDGSLRSGGDKDFGRRVVAAGRPLVFDARVRVAHPARADVTDLERKVRRVVGGEHAAARGRRRQLGKDILRYMVLRPVKALAQVVGCARLTWRERVGAASIVPRVALWQLHERARLMRGGSPRR